MLTLHTKGPRTNRAMVAIRWTVDQKTLEDLAEIGARHLFVLLIAVPTDPATGTAKAPTQGAGPTAPHRGLF